MTYLRDQLSHSPTSIPCPSWCALPPRHGHESQDAAHNVVRYHLADFTGPEATRALDTEATLSLCETAASAGGPVLPGDQPQIEVWVLGNTVDGVGTDSSGLTGPQARALAAALMNAADAWDEAVTEADA